MSVGHSAGFEGNRTGELRLIKAVRQLYNVERADCRSSVSVYGSKPFVRTFRTALSTFPEMRVCGAVIQTCLHLLGAARRAETLRTSQLRGLQVFRLPVCPC